METIDMTMLKSARPGLAPPRKFKTRLKQGVVVAALSTLMLVGGCIRLLPDPGKPPAVVAMRADPGLARLPTTAPFTIGIGLPTLPAVMSGTQIAVLREDGTYAYIERLRLAAHAPLSIQNVILETFDRAGATRAAVRAVTIARPDYELHFDVSAFDVTEPEGRRDGIARIEATARLIEVYTGKPLAAQVFRATAPAERGRPAEAIRALEAATRILARDAMMWSVQTGTPYHASKAASTTR
jgi:ABC-type uncharacterized transport system auxiliary subunit